MSNQSYLTLSYLYAIINVHRPDSQEKGTTMNRRLGIIVAVALVVTGVAGCGGSTKTDPVTCTPVPVGYMSNVGHNIRATRSDTAVVIEALYTKDSPYTITVNGKVAKGQVNHGTQDASVLADRSATVTVCDGEPPTAPTASPARS